MSCFELDPRAQRREGRGARAEEEERCRGEPLCAGNTRSNNANINETTTNPQQNKRYGDFTTTPSGLQFLDLKVGEGPLPDKGQTCVVDWSGYTIGYYGRPFEARNKPKGSSFTGDNKEFYRFKLGSGSVIAGFDEAVAGMRAGGIRRVVVPVELGYPDGDFKRTGPRPSTFAGERALDFVLSNRGMIDKTLLFDIELLRVDP